MLISYAIAALLMVIFLETLPHAFQISSSLEVMSATVLLGIMLGKLLLWHHCHGEACEVHAFDAHHHANHDYGRSGLMITIGDTFHNFVDGVLSAAAFLADVRLRFVTAVTIITHEIFQGGVIP